MYYTPLHPCKGVTYSEGFDLFSQLSAVPWKMEKKMGAFLLLVKSNGGK